VGCWWSTSAGHARRSTTPSGTSWFLQYFAVIFVALTLVVGFLAYRVVKDRDGAPDPVDALAGMKKK
jgi:hypothetical protein